MKKQLITGAQRYIKNKDLADESKSMPAGKKFIPFKGLFYCGLIDMII